MNKTPHKFTMRSKAIIIITSAIGIVLLVAGLVFSTKIDYKNSQKTLYSWRQKGVERYCGSDKPELMTLELRNKKVTTYYSYATSDCKGYDQVQYYAYDMVVLGSILLLGSAGYALIARKR